MSKRSCGTLLTETLAHSLLVPLARGQHCPANMRGEAQCGGAEAAPDLWLCQRLGLSNRLQILQPRAHALHARAETLNSPLAPCFVHLHRRQRFGGLRWHSDRYRKLLACGAAVAGTAADNARYRIQYTLSLVEPAPQWPRGTEIGGLIRDGPSKLAPGSCSTGKTAFCCLLPVLISTYATRWYSYLASYM